MGVAAPPSGARSRSAPAAGRAMSGAPLGDDVVGLGWVRDAQAQATEAIVIVDPYTSGRFLVEELGRRGRALVAVRSSLQMDAALLGTWNPVPFKSVVVHHGDLGETVGALRAVGSVGAVVAGSEPGVELAEALAAALNLRGNRPDEPKQRCRWDKYVMHDQLQACGLRSCRQKICRSMQEAAAFTAELGAWPRPVVVKPRSSMGEGCFFLCRSEDDLREAVEAVLASADVSGHPRAEVLVQEFLEGTEYVVDCVSMDGDHIVSGIWAYSKTRADDGFAYDTSRTLQYDASKDSVQHRLLRYIFGCLTALGVKNGPSHCEVVVSAGPPEDICLVKMGARMHGAMGPALWAKCAGREQAQPFMVADLFAEGGRTLRRKVEDIKEGVAPYVLSRVAMQVDLQCPGRGVLVMSVERSSGDWLRGLKTFSAMRIFVEEGDAMVPTRDLSTSPGFVVLLGSDKNVEADRDAIRDRERRGQLFVLRQVSFDGLNALREQMALARRHAVVNNPSERMRELEAEAEKLISPMASRAASPILSPQRAPMLPPCPGSDGGDDVEFMLDGAEGLDDFALDGGGAFDEGVGNFDDFALDGPDPVSGPVGLFGSGPGRRGIFAGLTPAAS